MSVMMDFSKKVFSWNAAFSRVPSLAPFVSLRSRGAYTISIRNNDKINDIKIGDVEKQISLLADDTTSFLRDDQDSFENLFDTLGDFATFSGCRINMSKSEAIHVGRLKGSAIKPFNIEGLIWKDSTFKTLGINFSLNVTWDSLNVNALYGLNLIPKLNQIHQILNYQGIEPEASRCPVQNFATASRLVPNYTNGHSFMLKGV